MAIINLILIFQPRVICVLLALNHENKIIALGEKAPDWVNQGAEHYTKRLVGSSIHLE